MIPDFGGIIWMFIALVEVIIFVIVALVFWFVVMPPISRRFIRAKWSKGSPSFIQHAGQVRLCISDAELPEGVIHNKLGWFLRSVNPYKGETQQKRGPGRPPKNPETQTQTDMAKIDEALDVVLRTPILDGLGKQCFFGSTDAPLLGNLETISALSKDKVTTSSRTIAHADLSVIKEVLPATLGRSQLDALGTYEYLRGLKVRGGDVVRLIIVVIAVIGVLGALGLIFWFLTK